MSALPSLATAAPAASFAPYGADDAQDEQQTLAADTLRGLTRSEKELSPLHFYDARGSALFDLICAQPEYYPAAAEQAILDADASSIVAAAEATELVELGCGPRRPTRTLLDAMVRAGRLERYLPVDVFAGAVEASVAALAREHASVAVHGLVGDFERQLVHLPVAGVRLVAIMGNVVGNYAPLARRRLLREIAGVLRAGDRVLMGVDLVQDPQAMLSAYDDAAGMTAEFNRNGLRVLNGELAADFPLGNFEHVAVYDSREEWVELRLRAREACQVRLRALDLEILFAAGEEIRTKVSAKFTRARVAADLAAAGLGVESWHTDPAERFAVALAAPHSDADPDPDPEPKALPCR